MQNLESRKGRWLVGKLERGDDLMGALVEVCRSHRIQAAEIRALGVVTNLAVTEYDIEAGRYREAIVRKEACEILQLYGNLSLREEELFAHLHITASYFENGVCVLMAGHLVAAEVFACEFFIDSLDDVSLVRQLDGPTGLWLWEDLKRR